MTLSIMTHTHNDTQHKVTQRHDTQHVTRLTSIDCSFLLSVIMLSVIMLSVIMLNVVMLKSVAQFTAITVFL
jgi:hypothetical protein